MPLPSLLSPSPRRDATPPRPKHPPLPALRCLGVPLHREGEGCGGGGCCDIAPSDGCLARPTIWIQLALSAVGLSLISSNQ